MCLATGRKVGVASWAQQLEHFRLRPKTESYAEREQVYNILQEMDVMTQQIERYCGGRRVFIGEAGWIGLCPPRAMEGDKVFAVKGEKVPVILRKVNGGLENKYRLVGECYCHGLEPEKLEKPELKVEVI